MKAALRTLLCAALLVAPCGVAVAQDEDGGEICEASFLLLIGGGFATVPVIPGSKAEEKLEIEGAVALEAGSRVELFCARWGAEGRRAMLLTPTLQYTFTTRSYAQAVSLGTGIGYGIGWVDLSLQGGLSLTSAQGFAPYLGARVGLLQGIIAIRWDHGFAELDTDTVTFGVDLALLLKRY